jgi:hypothetical protein
MTDSSSILASDSLAFHDLPPLLDRWDGYEDAFVPYEEDYYYSQSLIEESQLPEEGESPAIDDDEWDAMLLAEKKYESHLEYLHSLAPPVRRKGHRIIPMGKWWLRWKRGLCQKRVTLRCHRNPTAMRKGRRFLISGAFRTMWLEPGEGNRKNAIGWAHRS